MREDDEFFVGYLPTPPRTKRFSIAAAAVMLALALGAAALGVVGSGSTGRGFGAQAQTPAEGVVGLLQTHPYGVLWVPSDRGPSAILLVRQGKFGLGTLFDDRDGTIVSVHGYTLAREGRTMIELGAPPEPAELPADQVAMLRAHATTSSGPGSSTTVRIEGEIVDEKCWLGRMRPGAARTHRACAQLCVAGGIPPVIVGTDASGTAYAAIVVGADGQAITDEVLPYLAEPVAVTGELVRDGDLDYLRVAPGGLERL
jgi:hypothetical protein